MLKCLFFLILPILCFAQQDSSQLEHETEIGLALISKSKPFRFLTNTPGDVYQIFKSPFKKQYTTGFVATMVATGLLIPFDQSIADGVKHICRQMHLYSQTDYEVILKYKKARIIRIPRNLNSGLYQLGEGGTSVLLAAGLFAYGKLFHDNRSVGVAWDLTETFITMGMSTQIIKRITGRESPFRATADGGIWRPLPGFVEYQTNTSRYDAFPSGHLATMMATVTTLVLNYPNKKWLKPVGYGIIGLTAIAMINTDVHWISDYPLALALGFVAAKITFNRNHRSLNLRT
jgi:membrane-associated phospholipid phosphatase